MTPTSIIHSSWNPILHKLYEEPLKTLNESILPNTSFQPNSENIFRVFKTSLHDIKVVLLGQDPYPTKGDAIGLSFVNGTNKIPTSLRNIYKEIALNSSAFSKDIYSWESQGIFLLNTALTVETGKPGSHIKYWKDFTKRTIQFISSQHPTIWILWGRYAQSYKTNIANPFVLKNYPNEELENIPIKNDCNYILEAPHPASEAYSGGKSGFFGCNHFNMVNTILEARGLSVIDW